MLTLCSRRAARGPVCEALGLSGPRGRSAPRRAVTDGQSASGQRGWPADTWRPWHTDCDPIHTGHGPCNLAPRAHGRGGVGRGAGTRCPEMKTHSGHSQACECARHMDVSGTRPAHIALIGAPPGTPKATDERQASRARPASAQGGTSEAQPRAVWERRCTVPGEHRPLRGAGTSVWTAGATQRTPGPSRALPPKAKLLQRRLRGESRRKPHRSWGLVSRTRTTTAQRHETDNSKEGSSEEAHFHRHTNGEAAVKTLDTSGHRRSAGRGLRGTAGWRGRGGPGAPRTAGGCGAAATPHCAAPPKATVTARPRRRGHGEASAERGGNTSAETCPRASPWRGARQPPGGDRARIHPHGAVSLGHGKGQALTLVTRGRSSNTRRSARDAGCARPRGVRLHRGKRQNRRVRRQEAGEWVSGDGVGSEASFR